MKTAKITLSDSGYSKALELATMHDVPVEAYIASEVEDLLDNKLQCAGKADLQLVAVASKQPHPPPNYSPTGTDTLGQVLDVCQYVYRNGTTVPTNEVQAKREFIDALPIVANKWNGITVSSVRDKCTTS